MHKQLAQTASSQHPGMARWLEAYGTIEFGYCHHTRSAIRVQQRTAWFDGNGAATRRLLLRLQ